MTSNSWPKASTRYARNELVPQSTLIRAGNASAKAVSPCRSFRVIPFRGGAGKRLEPFSRAAKPDILAGEAEEETMTEPLANVSVGMTGRKEEVVTPELTVGGHVEGMPMVYGTPMMIMAMEVASARSVAPLLPPGWVTVGSEVNIRHLAPSPVGATIVATSRVIEISGRGVVFAVEAHDGERKIGEGTHRRGVVNVERFKERYPRP
jgi:predicted thioesterase